MVDTDELAALATDLESFRVERKASFESVESDVEEAICAFANDLPGTGLPGYVLLGVTDRTGEPCACSTSFSATGSASPWREALARALLVRAGLSA
jgi:predicted HTH transcriptional regulator